MLKTPVNPSRPFDVWSHTQDDLHKNIVLFKQLLCNDDQVDVEKILIIFTFSIYAYDPAISNMDSNINDKTGDLGFFNDLPLYIFDPARYSPYSSRENFTASLFVVNGKSISFLNEIIDILRVETPTKVARLIKMAENRKVIENVLRDNVDYVRFMRKQCFMIQKGNFRLVEFPMGKRVWWLSDRSGSNDLVNVGRYLRLQALRLITNTRSNADETKTRKSKDSIDKQLTTLYRAYDSRESIASISSIKQIRKSTERQVMNLHTNFDESKRIITIARVTTDMSVTPTTSQQELIETGPPISRRQSVCQACLEKYKVSWSCGAALKGRSQPSQICTNDCLFTKNISNYSTGKITKFLENKIKLDDANDVETRRTNSTPKIPVKFFSDECFDTIRTKSLQAVVEDEMDVGVCRETFLTAENRRVFRDEIVAMELRKRVEAFTLETLAMAL